MIPLKIEGADMRLDGNGTVRPLYVKIEDGCYISRWELTPEELEMLNQGGSVELWVDSSSHPPVFITTAPQVGENQ